MDKHPKLRAGYAYHLQSKAEWRDAPDDDWEIVVVRGLQEHYLGWRRVDGERVAIYRTREGVYAQKIL